MHQVVYSGKCQLAPATTLLGTPKSPISYIIRSSHGYLAPKGTSRGIQHDEFTLGGYYDAVLNYYKMVVMRQIPVG